MYGLLLENLATFIKAQWGEGKWESVRRHAGIDLVAFSIHHVYPETLMRRIARSAFQVLGVDERQFFKAMGVYFVQYVSQYGYDQLLSVLGRHLRDFLNGLDNLHEYLKFSYPKMRAPSFYCDDETESGLKLHYRSKRRGFVYYVMGQIKQVAKQFYNQECNIHLLTEEVVGETIHVVFELAFDNSAFSEAEELRTLIGKDLRLPVRASTLFELFPFCIVFNAEMEITHTGHTLMTILKDLVGQVMTEAFDMTRPLIPFCFSAIMQRRNNIFELITVAPIHDVNQYFGATDSIDDEKETEGTRLRLRGQMLYMEDWNMMLYLANPVMPDLNGLVDCSLFINDLSLHDCSRDLVLAGTQQSVELKLALDQEQQKSRKLVQSMKKLDEEMKRTDELLYQMIPKQVADRIRKGENPVETCQTYDSVSILFTDVVNFTDICSQITPLQVVSMLNHMYFLFDQLSERNGVYKVETVGDSYMVVSGIGAPVPNVNHADRICDMALDIIDASEAIDDPSGRENGLKVRVGCHSGAVVAGVVGIKMPRYCLFGDTVNTASRMESTAEPGRIQISEACKNLLPALYQSELRGTINIKGKGEMFTYWLLGREARVPLSKYYSKTIIWTAPTAKLLEGIGRPTSPKHLDRVGLDILQVAPSPSTSGIAFKAGPLVPVPGGATPTNTYKPTQPTRIAAAYKNPALRMKPQLQFKFTRKSTDTSSSMQSSPRNSPTEPLRNVPASSISGAAQNPQSQHQQRGTPTSCHTSGDQQQGTPSESHKPMSKGNRGNVEDLEMEDNIQVYFKSIEKKRKEASAQFQEKLKQKIQPTTIYDSDLIKEAFKSPVEKKPLKKGISEHGITESFCFSEGGDVLSADEQASMIIAGLIPDKTNFFFNQQSNSGNKCVFNMPTSAGEGLLTEYIMQVEKGSHETDREKKDKARWDGWMDHTHAHMEHEGDAAADSSPSAPIKSGILEVPLPSISEEVKGRLIESYDFTKGPAPSPTPTSILALPLEEGEEDEELRLGNSGEEDHKEEDKREEDFFKKKAPILRPALRRHQPSDTLARPHIASAYSFSGNPMFPSGSVTPSTPRGYGTGVDKKEATTDPFLIMSPIKPKVSGDETESKFTFVLKESSLIDQLSSEENDASICTKNLPKSPASGKSLTPPPGKSSTSPRSSFSIEPSKKGGVSPTPTPPPRPLQIIRDVADFEFKPVKKEIIPEKNELDTLRDLAEEKEKKEREHEKFGGGKLPLHKQFPLQKPREHSDDKGIWGKSGSGWGNLIDSDEEIIMPVKPDKSAFHFESDSEDKKTSIKVWGKDQDVRVLEPKSELKVPEKARENVFEKEKSKASVSKKILGEFVRKDKVGEKFQKKPEKVFVKMADKAICRIYDSEGEGNKVRKEEKKTKEKSGNVFTSDSDENLCKLDSPKKIMQKISEKARGKSWERGQVSRRLLDSDGDSISGSPTLRTLTTKERGRDRETILKGKKGRRTLDSEGDSQPESPSLTSKKGDHTVVLIGNKLAEVRVEKWIREEFAEKKKDSVQDEGSEEDDPEAGQGQSGICISSDDKWIPDALASDGDGDEKWIREDMNDIPSGKKSKFLPSGDSSTVVSPITKKSSPRRLSPENAPQWRVEVTTRTNYDQQGCHIIQQDDKNQFKHHHETLGTEMAKVKPTKAMEKFVIAVDDKAKKGREDKIGTEIAYTDIPEMPMHFVASTPKIPTDPKQGTARKVMTVVSRPSLLDEEVKKREQRKVEGEPATKSQSQSQHLVIMKGPPPPSLKKVDKNYENLSELEKDTEQEKEKNDNDVTGEESKGPERETVDRFHLFSAEGSGGFQHSPSEIAKNFNQNCVKFCYDCLSFPDYVDDDFIGFENYGRSSGPGRDRDQAMDFPLDKKEKEKVGVGKEECTPGPKRSKSTKDLAAKKLSNFFKSFSSLTASGSGGRETAKKCPRRPQESSSSFEGHSHK